MNLNDWVSIPENERRALIIEWCQNRRWRDYEAIAIEVAEVLKNQLISMPLVTYINPVADGSICTDGVRDFPELVLKVCTLLPDGGRLEKLPNQFAGFRVEQMNLGSKRESFIRTWKRIFKELKGWDEEQTLKWMEKWSEALDGRRSPLYHWGPIKVIVPELVDENTKKLAGNKLQHLYNAVRDVIEKNENRKSVPIEHPDTIPNYDWEYVRRKIKEVTAMYIGTA